jgi:mRNA interferase HicA
VKQKDLMKRLRAMAKERGLEFRLVREGSKHEIHRFGSLLVSIPRHKEINELTANGILDACREEGER